MAALSQLFDALARNPAEHRHSTEFYQRSKAAARPLIESLFSSTQRQEQEFGPFGRISLPYTKMGAIDSLDLFGLDELIIFAFYNANRASYRKVIDIGANLGLHSIVLSRCGFSVKAFEPDAWHYGILSANLAANGASSVQPVEAAVSTQDGEAKFVRVLGNTTGSHLAGSKDSYGEKEIFTVKTLAVQPLFEWADLAKIDAEGHEKELLLAATAAHLQKLDFMVEIGNPANASAVFGHFRSIGVGMYAQKIGWRRAERLEDIPTSHREGSLFLSAKPAMPWPR